MPVEKLLFIAGTRPELIKIFPVVRELRGRYPSISTKVCLTQQHKELVAPILRDFGFEPDLWLDSRPDGSSGLAAEAARIVTQATMLVEKEKPDVVVVQGDTTSTFAGALAAFYQRVPVAHIEAGLRTSNRYAPYPEEMNRRLTSSLTDLHFAPTERARASLRAEGIAEASIHVTGNPVIDIVLEIASGAPESVGEGGPRILVTLHRREIFGEPLERVCEAIERLVGAVPDAQLLWPVHLNPLVREVVLRRFSMMPRVHLMEPCGYRDFVRLMKRATLILTDSGGVQEEAPALGVPVLVLREETERPEGVDAGVCLLVGLDPERITTEALRILASPAVRAQMSRGASPYGDGHASARIAKLLVDFRR